MGLNLLGKASNMEAGGARHSSEQQPVREKAHRWTHVQITCQGLLWVSTEMGVCKGQQHHKG